MQDENQSRNALLCRQLNRFQHIETLRAGKNIKPIELTCGIWCDFAEHNSGKSRTEETTRNPCIWKFVFSQKALAARKQKSETDLTTDMGPGLPHLDIKAYQNVKELGA